jgi:ubiquinone/menaquinone biosynthesis C-methylase UbiE
VEGTDKMSTARKEKEIAFHDKVFATNSEPRKAIAKYYRTSNKAHAFYRKLGALHCKGKRLLEYGCATGGDSVFWSQSDAMVTGIDISSEAIKKAREETMREGVNVDYHLMDAENLQFEESSFDVVVGAGILHHLNLKTSYAELSRVLRKDGHAVFIEPMGHNALINLYRKYTPSMRTEDEHPLLMEDIQLARQYFNNLEARFFNLFTLLAVPFRNMIGFDVLVNFLSVIDNIAFFVFPFMRKYAWMVVLHASDPKKMSHAPVRTGLPAVE